MIEKLKRNVHHLIDRAGYALSRKTTHAYPQLINASRYEESIVQLSGQDFKIADAHSFRYSFDEIFGQEIYKFPCDHNSPRIIDCGSNYGTSIVYFKEKFPEARVTAIECDPAVFKILQWNITHRGIKGIDLLHKAVSDSEKSVRFFREGADAGRLVPHESFQESVEVETIRLDDMLDEPVDFLKMDIEGEETSALTGSNNLDNVRSLFVEYHSFVDRPQKLEMLLAKLAESGFRYYIHTQYCAPRPLIDPSEYLGMDLQLNIFATR